MGAAPRVVIVGAGFGGIGPNTNLAHNSIIHTLGSQYADVRDAVRRIARGEVDALDVRADVQERLNATIGRRLEDMVWDAGCSSWYLTGSRRKTLNWPGLTIESRHRTRRIDPDDHEQLEAPEHAPLMVVPSGRHLL